MEKEIMGYFIKLSFINGMGKITQELEEEGVINHKVW